MTPNTKHPLSLCVSYILCTISLIAVPIASVFLPHWVMKALALSGRSAVYVITLLYIGVAIAAVVLCILLGLLRLTRRGAILTDAAARLVSVVAVLVIAEGGIFAAMSPVALSVFALAITVVAVVLGCCLFVVSHVLREAAAIKEENDGTI